MSSEQNLLCEVIAHSDYGYPPSAFASLQIPKGLEESIPYGQILKRIRIRNLERMRNHRHGKVSSASQIQPTE